AEPERIGLVELRKCLSAFRLVRDQHNRLADAPQPTGKMTIERRQTGTRIDDQKGDISLVERTFGLYPHSAAEHLRRRLLEPGGIDQAEGEIGDMAFTLAAVARDPGHVVDQRQ